MSGDQAEFPPLEHSVYSGRERLGRYSRVGVKQYAAYDAGDAHLGNFKSRRAAYRAVSDANAVPKRSTVCRRRRVTARGAS